MVRTVPASSASKKTQSTSPWPGRTVPLSVEMRLNVKSLGNLSRTTKPLMRSSAWIVIFTLTRSPGMVSSLGRFVSIVLVAMARGVKTFTGLVALAFSPSVSVTVSVTE
ncbi:hypothetical protein HRbin07_00465 [bacterium HR07]|nr:hypothetical protein HRbin07_00465 [bacterium HR07]